jgi:hypothetical protein
MISEVSQGEPGGRKTVIKQAGVMSEIRAMEREG